MRSILFDYTFAQSEMLQQGKWGVCVFVFVRKRKCVCICLHVCFLVGAECILYESALLRPFHKERWVQLCCVSLCWQMIQRLYCESIVKLLSRPLSQWIQRNRLTKLLHYVFLHIHTTRYMCDCNYGSLKMHMHEHLCGAMQRRMLLVIESHRGLHGILLIGWSNCWVVGLTRKRIITSQLLNMRTPMRTSHDTCSYLLPCSPENFPALSHIS